MSANILLSHGSGGRLSRRLIEEEILSRFGGGALSGLPDAAVLSADGKKLVFSTDSFVVTPLFFPGGDIGDLSVYGTVNDISVSGGRPRWLSLGLIIEEGFSLESLRRILDSVKRAAQECEVMVVTGDTKVVRRGQCDGIYINTAGIGEIIEGFSLSACSLRPGDCILVSGGLGEHGMAVFAAREELQVKSDLISDTGSVHRLVGAISGFASGIRVMRDPTRGGFAAVLHELAAEAKCGALIDEAAIPVSPAVRALCEMLGFDPLHIACEGRVVAICDPSVCDDVLGRWRSFSEGRGAVCLGSITSDDGRIVLDTLASGKRIVDVPEGELLPRIC